MLDSSKIQYFYKVITRKTIDDIFTTARVEEVIGDFVQLKKSGSNYKGLSPFSDEKTPSFMVSPAKQIWKDFSSGKGGNVVTFLMEHEQFSYPEALKWLAKKYNITVEEEQTEQTDEQKEELKLKESLYLISEFANQFFQNQLNETEEGKTIGLSYFKERGFNQETIQTYQLGYSPKQWDAFVEFALKKGYSKELLEQSGLGIFKEGGKQFDRFRERVIFPIHSFSGRTLGFGGRILRSDVKAAKYLNSPESEIYHKSKILYGIYQAKQEILKQNQCYLVEGYTDVISLYQSGIKNVVASSGTALTPDQIRLIKRLTPNVTLLYDGDTAGIKASFRGIDLILEQELNVKVLLFPDGEDPDSFAKKHSSSEIESYLNENATDFIQFKTKVLLAETQNDPVKKASVIREIVQSIALIPNLIQREIYIRETASLMDFREEVLFKELAQIQQKKRRDANRNQKSKNENQSLAVVESAPQESVVNSLLLVEEELIRLLLQYGDCVISLSKNEENETKQEELKTTVLEEIITQLKEDDLEFSHAIHQNIFSHLEAGFENNEIRTGDFFRTLMDTEIQQSTSSILMDQHKASEYWTKQGIYIPQPENQIEKKVEDTILNFKLLHLKKMIQDLGVSVQNQEITGEVRQELLQKVMQLTKYKNQMKQYLNRVV